MKLHAFDMSDKTVVQCQQSTHRIVNKRKEKDSRTCTVVQKQENKVCGFSVGGEAKEMSV